MIKSYKDLIVYQLSYNLALEIYKLTRCFPKEEKYLLIDQMQRASRSIPSNICEGWAKRKYKNVFLRHLSDSNGSCLELKVWLDFSKDLNYICHEKHAHLINEYNRVGAMLNSLSNNWTDRKDRASLK